MEIVWFVVVVVVCVGMMWLSRRIEPHWVSKDGRRFICQGQLLTLHGDPLDRWRETRVQITVDGDLEVTQKKFLRRARTYWRLAAESPEPPRGRAVFLLADRDEQLNIFTLRLPKKSKALDQLRSLLPG